MGKRYYPIDANTLFCEDKVVTASGVIKDGASADIVLAIGPGQQDFAWVVDINLIETDSSNELYTLLLQGCNDIAFGSGIVNLDSFRFGHTAVIPGGAITTLAGRYTKVTKTEYGGVDYKYVRLNVIVAGTIVTGIKFSSWLSPDS